MKPHYSLLASDSQCPEYEHYLDRCQATTPKSTTDSVPPLNTDIRIESILPEYFEIHNTFQSTALDGQAVQENFSWHLPDNLDSKETAFKKSLINPVQNQHLCGSCWAMALAACISDCLVVYGAVLWMPRIAPTFLMTSIPATSGNGQCNGGNPASAAVALESMYVADTTCVDYSWCSNEKTCTSRDAAEHFKGTLATKLNKNIPKPGNSCYYAGERYLYQIDSQTRALFINSHLTPDQFRTTVKTHLLTYGPPLAGYAVYKNFVSGEFTRPDVNQGVYFDRACYPAVAGTPLEFDDSKVAEHNLAGLHAVEVVGWGLARNVCYDSDSYGDVPYWWAKNSWGSRWGHMGGYFKIAMYPWNRSAQFGKQIRVKDANVGGLILIKCTRGPKIGTLPSIPSLAVSKAMPDTYYQRLPSQVREGEPSSTGLPLFAVAVGLALFLLGLGVIVLRHRSRV